MLVSLRIVFFGTPEFASYCLEQIARSTHPVVGVVTVADKPKGRGKKISTSAVKQSAEKLNIPILQPLKLKDPDFLSALNTLKADVFVVVAFRMLPKVVWEMPIKGTFNLHASLLPQYRGAAPINWAIINGETQTGVTTFFIDDKIDTGEIILQQTQGIPPEYSAGDLHDRLKETGGELILETLDLIAQTSIPPTKTQNHKEELKKAPKLNKENTKINFNQPAEAIHNFIRGLSPYPVAYCYLNQKKLKVYKAHYKCTSDTAQPGKCEVENGFLKVYATDGYLCIEELQIEGKKRMASADFLRGYEHSKITTLD